MLCALAGLLLLGAALPADAAPTADVRIFEVRRANSDFSPMENLSFRIRTDGRGVRLEHWLATLARRVPGAYLAQLATLRFGPDETKRSLDRGRRSISVELLRSAGPDVTVAVRLLQDGAVVQEMRREVEAMAGGTAIASGREFELTLSRYLSWFREPGTGAQREALYERLRNRNVFLVVGISLPESDPDSGPPVRLEPPDDPALMELESPLIGSGEGTVRLRVRLDEAGAPESVDVEETTLPEVVPRIVGLVRGWRFPESARRAGRLELRVRTR